MEGYALNGYEPVKGTKDLPHVGRHVIVWGVASVGFLGFAWVLLYEWPVVAAVMRPVLVEKVVTIVPNLWAATGILVLWDIITRGQLIRGILHGNIAAAILASALFFGTLFSMAWRT